MEYINQLTTELMTGERELALEGPELDDYSNSDIE